MATTEQDVGPYVGEAAFARTYAARVYDDAHQAVTDYREVMGYHADHPERGAGSIGRLFNLPRGRVQAWLNGSRPNPVRGLDIAESHGWIDPNPHGETMRGLNVLVAWIHGRGSIASDTWTPYFVTQSEADRGVLEAAADYVDVNLDFSRSATDGRTQELRPMEAGSVLGRVLHVLGAPRGEKGRGEPPELPAYLGSGPDHLGRTFVQVLLHTLGGDRDGRSVIEPRPAHGPEYASDLADLVRRLTGETVSTLDGNVVLSKPATREIVVWDPLPGLG